MSTVLFVCHNPTTDGEVVWEGHTLVGYVDITPAIRTQAERQALFEKKRKELDENEEATKEMLAENDNDEDELEYLKAELENIPEQREELEEEAAKPLDVERLSKVYFQGWESVPKDLKVDIVFGGFCPLGLDSYQLKAPLDGVYYDIFVRSVEFLKPGGQLIITQATTKPQPLLETLFAVKYAQPLPNYPRNTVAKQNYKNPVMILTKKTGGSKKTRRSKKYAKRTRSRK